MSSIKDQYIHEVIDYIDNPIIKRRLKKELEAHFEDALAFERNDSERNEERIRDDLGDPKEIVHIANDGHVSILTFLKRYTKRGIVGALALFLCILSIGTAYLFDRLNDSEKQMILMDREISKLQQEVTRIDLLDQKITDLLYNSSIALDFAVLYHNDGSKGTLVKTVLNPKNSTSPETDVTAVVPTGLPIVMTFGAKIPSDIIVRETFGQLTFWVKTSVGEELFCRYQLYSSISVTRKRSEINGSIVLAEGDLKLSSGLYLIRYITPYTTNLHMTSNQYEQAETLIKHNITMISNIPFPVIEN